jgi:3-oxoacyl-[acyl-carrier-protein] synthase II
MTNAAESTGEGSRARWSGHSVRPADIVGIGAVTGYGWGTKHLWDGFLLGESAVRPVTGLDGFVPGGVAYLSMISDDGDRADGPSRFMRSIRFAAREAIADARERGWEPGPVVGLVHALEMGDVEMWSAFYKSGQTRVRPKTWMNMMSSTVLTQFMKENDFHGPTMSVSAMCAGGNTALITAKTWLDAGIASDVIVLATDLSCIPQNLRAFSDLGTAVLDLPALDGCRPFQEGSRGFVGGEAAVATVLSSRDTGSYASVLGGAMTHDGYHSVSIAPDLREMIRCFELALHNADVDAADVAYLNAHGPGTALCDASEARVLDELFPSAHGIFSVKPLVGHCQAAAASVEMLATIYAFQTGFIPAPPQVAPGHPRLVNGLTARVPGLMVKSSVGMGGYNTVVVVAEPDL